MVYPVAETASDELRQRGCQLLRPVGRQSSVNQVEESMKRTTIAMTGISAAAAISLGAAGPALAGSAATAALKSCSASVTKTHPADYTTTDVKVRTAPGVEVFTVAHYKTVNRAYYRIANSAGRATIAYYVSGATPGHRVVVDVTVVSAHQANSCSTSFTPKS
jgi:hypothetical protein